MRRPGGSAPPSLKNRIVLSLSSDDDLTADAMQTLFDTGSQQDAAEFGAALAAPAVTGRYDELRGGAAALSSASLAPAWRAFFTQLGSVGFADLDRRADALQRRMRENGLAYHPHERAAGGGAVRPWSLDLLPLIIAPDDWAAIERGVLQRVRLSNAILADLYGEQTILRRGLLPPALVTGHPGYLRPMCGAQAPGGTWLHVAAFDLARGPDGAWRLMAQHTQGPAGLGYLLENRLIVSRLFPRAFRGLHVQRLAASYRALLQSMQALSPARKNSRIVLLTPGPHAATYFEHAYLARYLGLTLVEGGDLTARDQRVYLKTLRGLEPVHGILRRVDDEWLDPLELRPDSLLGVPGLMQAVRAGNVLLANLPGSGFLESPGILGFLPRLAQALLDETLTLPAVHSWWCGEQAACDEALPLLARGIVKPTFPASVQAGGAFEPVIGARLSPRQLADWRARIAAHPAHYTIQADLPLSQAPTWAAGAGMGDGGARIVPRPLLLRVFALADGARSWRVLPGGLARVGTRDELFNAPMPHGGSSVDTWVMTEGAVDPTTLLQTHLGPDDLQERSRAIASRAAENLFWLGRYTERATNLTRLARAALERLRGEDDVETPVHLHVLDALCRDNGLLPADAPPAVDAPRAFQQALTRSLTPRADRSTGIASCLFGMRGAAAAIRERLSREQWRLIDEATQLFDEGGDDAEPEEQLGNDALQRLERLNLLLSAITGAQTDNMTRDDGWRLLSIGRQIDRLEFLCGVLGHAFDGGAIHKQEGFELVLELFDSGITFRSRFQRCFDVAPLLSLVVLDTDNPRSLAWVAQALRGRLSKVERSEGYALSELADGIPDIAGWPLHVLCETDGDGRHAALLARLQACGKAAWDVSNRIGERYFSHVRDAGRSLWG
ncbi:circularly permuted type 2 ATP-grasp protein [Burkholderia pseudomallei]|uniref:circularly permuted type 2 ATP-grasp protein n=1 Tax=Burkholderia pseudomallei TaxID=28450 RepID=UPI0005F2F4DA|nr:circularly permuted type 2 ATP-grasp protein [Burkholderia pseudomallei]KJR91999.1 A circularly permuted ATPgrasp family protein [Burkholderia pseudomallei]MDA5591341.1 circularly permuted type 2 ATP-grasp protein [Burkholderia pseudomallei]OND65805.1 A circularly permuted ATPgrasp family protein [Burkholderia pseudomallei]OND82453.1 A circularly permuted ATPgrasp family protein [Burkholderia pseudomallei]OND84101.1 A circularly permuted ATPgrasp family protein [Burkholderia pseudomallei]